MELAPCTNGIDAAWEKAHETCGFDWRPFATYIFNDALAVGQRRSLRAISAALLGISWMNALLTDPASAPPKAGDAGDTGLRTLIWSVLSSMYPDAGRTDRRREERFPFPCLVRLTPLADDGRTPLDGTFTVAGKHVSERGLGFYHPKPLAYRRMIASLERGDGDWVSFVLDVSWCRFNSLGWYESGGRFLRPATWFDRTAALAG
jgi:hypothetical protein